MKKLAIAIALSLPLAATAIADDKADALASCKAAADIQLAKENLPPEQKAMVQELSARLCGCVVDKVAAEMGEDGEKVLRVLAKMPPEKMAENADPGKDKSNSVEVLVAEYGMSSEEAGAFYDRINPQVEAINNTCVSDIMGAAGPK